MKVSKTGYKKNSKDKNEESLLIPSNRITMKNVEFPVYGVDDTGYSQMMYPGSDYTFPGNYVYELPVKKGGGHIVPGRYRNPEGNWLNKYPRGGEYVSTNPEMLDLKQLGNTKYKIGLDPDKNFYVDLGNGTQFKFNEDLSNKIVSGFSDLMPGYDPHLASLNKDLSSGLPNFAKSTLAKPIINSVVHSQEKKLLAEIEAEEQKQKAELEQKLLEERKKKGIEGREFVKKLLNLDLHSINKSVEDRKASKYSVSDEYQLAPYKDSKTANEIYEKTPDYKIRYAKDTSYSEDDIKNIQSHLVAKGYLEPHEQINPSDYKTKDQIIALQKKLFKAGLGDVMGKEGPYQDGVTGVISNNTLKAINKYNESQKSFNIGELDDKTKTALKKYRNITDAQNVLDIEIADPNSLIDPETGLADVEKSTLELNLFEDALIKKGYFQGRTDYDFTNDPISPTKPKYRFTLNSDPKNETKFGYCMEYVNSEICRDDAFGDEAREELGLNGDAWHVSENIIDKGGSLVFAGLPDRSTINLNSKNDITQYLKSTLTSPETVTGLQDLIGSGNIYDTNPGTKPKLQPGDVVNIFYEGSDFTEQAYKQTKNLNNRFFTTHVGVVKVADNGDLYIEHNIHHSIHKDKPQDFINGKIKGNGSKKVSLIAGITRPNYATAPSNIQSLGTQGLSYYDNNIAGLNPKGFGANPAGWNTSGNNEYVSIGNENTAKYINIMEKNKDKLLQDIPITENEYVKLARIARAIPVAETGAKDDYNTRYTRTKDGVTYPLWMVNLFNDDETSMGFTRLKDETNLNAEIREKLYGDDDSQLDEPTKAALPTFYLLSKNYLYLKEVANKYKVKANTDELVKLAGLGYNQSIGRIAKELVDKGSYDNYINYRKETAASGDGQYRYSNVLNAYDLQTKKYGGPTKWLDRYQDGGSKNKNFRRSVDSEYTKKIQKMLNNTYGTGLSVDGIWGPLTEKAYQNHIQINNLQRELDTLGAKQQAFKNEDTALRKVDVPTSKLSTAVVVPKAKHAEEDVKSVRAEAARVKKKMQETGAKSEAEVYAKEQQEKQQEKIFADILASQGVIKPAEEKTSGDYIGHAWDIVSNPLTAARYKIMGQEIPWGFTHSSQGRNPMDYGVDVINPAFYANAAGRLSDTAITPETYTKTLPQGIAATAALLMNEEVPEEWNDEAIKTLGIIGDALIVSQGLKAVSEIGTAVRNAKSSNFLNVKQEHPLPDLHFKDSKEFLNWYKKTQNNRPLTNKEINFLNKELKERGILEVQRSHPLNPLPNLTKRMLIPEDYDWKNVISNVVPNLIKSTKGLENVYKDYVMGPGRLNAFNQWLGLPTQGTMYRVHPESFQGGKGLLYTTTGNSMKGVFDPELKRLVPKSKYTEPVGKETFDELDIAIKAANKEPYQQQLQDLGYSDLASFIDDRGLSVSSKLNTVGDWDKYTGSAGGASWVRVPKKGGGYKWTMRDTWDIQPFSRMASMPRFVRDIDVAKLIGAKNFDVNWTYHTSPKFNNVSNVYYPGRSWSIKKDGGWLNKYQDGREVAADATAVKVNPLVRAINIDKPLSNFDYQNYYDKANKYLSRDIFKGTTLTAKDIADAANEFYTESNYQYPLDLLLTQAQIESKLGKQLKSKHNYFNVGNTDSGATRDFASAKDSVRDYINLMYNDYLNKGQKSVDELLKPKGFVNYQGNRYASNPDYENMLSSQMQFINNYLKDYKNGGWLDKYQGETEGSQVPANLPWINQQGQFTEVPAIEPKSFEEIVDDFLDNPQQKARNIASYAGGVGNDPVDNVRHPAAAMYTTEKLGSSLSAALAANALGAAHEIYKLPEMVKHEGLYHGLRSTAEDLLNNAVGSGIGMLPLPINTKESLLLYLSDNNMLPDGVSMDKGDMYWKKKKGGITSQGMGYFDYINGYRGVSS